MKNKILVTNTIAPLLWVIIFMAGLCFAQTEEPSPSIDPERELIVRFHPDAVVPLSDSTQRTLDDFQILSVYKIANDMPEINLMEIERLA